MTDNRARTGRFQKGRSGNPHGRPKAEGEIRDLGQTHGRADLERLVELMKSENERVAVIAAQAVLDRAYGKPPQSLQVDGEIGVRGTLTIIR